MLLKGDERREMAWGIGQRLLPLPRNQLDIPQTVQQLPARACRRWYISRPARHVKFGSGRSEVHQNPDLNRLVEEISLTLQAGEYQCVYNAVIPWGAPQVIHDGQGTMPDLEQRRASMFSRRSCCFSMGRC
ncbi:MAG: hypothetical protein R3E95_10245 [Thiolinea sp.]